MIHIVAKTPRRRLPFYLALEEWVARRLPPAVYFFCWRVEPTVIFGRNQNVATEVDLDYCRENSIQVYRRRSGGGCVYADLDNIMMSYITPATDVVTTFASYTERVAAMLRSLGLDAEASGRNDVLIAGLKVSGNAFYHIPGRSIVHGTMLYSTDMDNMLKAITPSRSKLESKQVASVESRITTVSSHLPDMSIDEFEKYMIDFFTDSEYVLSDDDIAAVEEIERNYYDLSWIFGKRGVLGSPKNQFRVLRRIPGVGELDMMVEHDGQIVKDVDIKGDFFLLSDLDEGLLDKLKGCRMTRECLLQALATTDVASVISGLSTEAFVDFFLQGIPPRVSRLIN